MVGICAPLAFSRVTSKILIIVNVAAGGAEEVATGGEVIDLLLCFASLAAKSPRKEMDEISSMTAVQPPNNPNVGTFWVTVVASPANGNVPWPAPKENPSFAGGMSLHSLT